MKKFLLAAIAAMMVFAAWPTVGHAQSPVVGSLRASRDLATAQVTVHGAVINGHSAVIAELQQELASLKAAGSVSEAKVAQLLRKANEGCWAVAPAAQAACFTALDKWIAAASSQSDIDKDALTAFVSVVRRDRSPVKTTRTVAGTAGTGATTVVTEGSTPVSTIGTTGGMDLASLGLGGGSVLVERTTGAGEHLPGSSLTLRYDPPEVPAALRLKLAKVALGDDGSSVWKKIGIAAGLAAAGCAAGGGMGLAFRPGKIGDGQVNQSGFTTGCLIGAGVAGLAASVWQFSEED